MSHLHFNLFKRTFVINITVALSFLILLLPVYSKAEIATLDEFKALGEKFDHLTTGYALTGEHGQLDCGECHIEGVFEALPRVCDACHDNVIASGKTANHVETTAPCDTCHTTSGFIATAVMDHSIVAGACASCHDGVSATGKSATHVATSNLCDACHTTNIWQPVRTFDHDQSVGSCITCHNNVVESGKSPSHMPTTNACEACHTHTGGWVPVDTVDHGEVLGRCSLCHNGVITIGKSDTHIVTNEECNACHTPGGNWADAVDPTAQPLSVQSKPVDTLHLKVSDNCESCHTKSGSFDSVSMNHSEVIGSCMDCHNGSIARGKGPNHVATIEDCGSCHTPGDTSWSARNPNPAP